jgi:hypothetical protein
MSYPCHAVFAIGKPDCISMLSNDLADLSKEAVFFFLTEKQYVNSIGSVNWHNQPIVILTETLAEYSSDILSVQNNMIQWLRYKYTIDALYRWELEHGHRFTYLHKIRTDIVSKTLRSLVSSANEAALNNFNALLCGWDFLISGRREFMCPLRGVIEFAQSLPDPSVQYTFPYNLSQYRESEPNLFYADYFPKHDVNTILTKEQYIDSVLNIMAQDLNPWTSYWPEHYLARFANLAGIPIKYYPNDSYYARLSPWRAVENDAQANILRQLEDKNFTILDDPNIPFHELPAKIGSYLAEQADSLRESDVQTARALLHAAMKTRIPEYYKQMIQHKLSTCLPSCEDA